MLQSALAMSVEPSATSGTFSPDAMTEEQQIAFALQMSLANDAEAMEADSTPAPTSTTAAGSTPAPVSSCRVKLNIFLCLFSGTL